MLKLFLSNNISDTITHGWVDKRVHTFPKGISPKVNVIARLEFELIYFKMQSSTLVITPQELAPLLFCKNEVPPEAT